MFTGIIEALGNVTRIEREGTNVHFTVSSSISSGLKIDQSVAHNGVCLTVVSLNDQSHTVTAIEETLVRSNLGQLEVGDTINLERAMRANARLDGHMVQGHVDATGSCIGVEKLEGSWYFHFKYPFAAEHLLVDKGSICVNGVSLTVVNPKEDGEWATFTVAIIPYTYEHTNFGVIEKGDTINLEFDVIGKYVSKYLALYAKK